MLGGIKKEKFDIDGLLRREDHEDVFKLLILYSEYKNSPTIFGVRC